MKKILLLVGMISFLSLSSNELQAWRGGRGFGAGVGVGLLGAEVGIGLGDRGYYDDGYYGDDYDYDYDDGYFY